MACQRLKAGRVSSKATSSTLVKIAFGGTCLIAICEPNALRALELLTVAASKDLDDPPICVVQIGVCLLSRAVQAIGLVNARSRHFAGSVGRIHVLRVQRIHRAKQY